MIHVVYVEDGDTASISVHFMKDDYLETTLGDMVMKRFVASVLLAIALLTSGVVVTQYSMVGTAQADDGGGE